MAQNITLLGASYSDVPAVTLPKTGGGTASFTDVTDTTAAAADVAAGKYFYTASGVRTLGTSSGGGGTGTITQDQDGYLVLSPDGGGGGGGGIDIPVFTATYDGTGEQLLSFVCNKTFAQVDAYFDNSNNCGAVLITAYPDDEIYNAPLALNYDDWESATPNITCTQVDTAGFPALTFSFLRNGTLTTPEWADVYEEPTFAQNGTFYPTPGKLFSGVTVAVPTPTPTLVTKTITQNGTYNASSDNADGYSSVTVNVGSSNTATMTLVNNSPYTLQGWLVTTNGYQSYYLSSNSSTTITGIACRTYDGDICPVFQLNASTGSGNYQATYQSPNWSSSTMTKYALTASQSLWQNNSLPVPSNNRTFTVTVSIAT